MPSEAQSVDLGVPRAPWGCAEVFLRHRGRGRGSGGPLEAVAVGAVLAFVLIVIAAVGIYVVSGP